MLRREPQPGPMSASTPEPRIQNSARRQQPSMVHQPDERWSGIETQGTKCVADARRNASIHDAGSPQCVGLSSSSAAPRSLQLLDAFGNIGFIPLKLSDGRFNDPRSGECPGPIPSQER